MSEWEHPFFGSSFVDETCVLGWLLPCFLYGKTQARLRNRRLSDFTWFNRECCAWAFLAWCGFSSCIQSASRHNLRKRFGLPGNICFDFCGSLCCPCFALVQEEREVAKKIRNSDRAYQEPEGMIYTGKDYLDKGLEKLV
ncbi:hypothetical protein HRR80_002789 [Exophiala dermatitidis]|uniref:PLAC8 family protein n=1 Tax=Exophiala dermatitidis TaxID=5970 RepID=A0AAN6IWJ4_EXODE|nr:hypothetical protein HRR80_002789 [Exophiala dermatitidis]